MARRSPANIRFDCRAPGDACSRARPARPRARRAAPHCDARPQPVGAGVVGCRVVSPLEAPAYRSGYRPRVTLDASSQSPIVLALAVVVALLVVWVALLQRSEARLRRRLRRVLTGGETTSVDQILDQHGQRLDGL